MFSYKIYIHITYHHPFATMSFCVSLRNISQYKCVFMCMNVSRFHYILYFFVRFLLVFLHNIHGIRSVSLCTNNRVYSSSFGQNRLVKSKNTKNKLCLLYDIKCGIINDKHQIIRLKVFAHSTS